MTFSEGVYGTAGGSGALNTLDFSLTFAQNGGTATNVTIASVTKTNGSALAGGETVVRVNLNVAGMPSGVETIEINPADDYSIFDIGGNAASSSTTTGSIALFGIPWYNPSWVYRIKITIDHTKVAGNLTNFPWLVSIASNASLASHAQSDGDDILFTGSDSVTKLDHEIESYVSGTGQLLAWVRIPTLSSTVDTDIYLYYGNPSASNQANPTGVWDSNYKGVWHLREETPGTGTAGLYKDSTANVNHGNDYVSSTGQAGKIGYGKQFDGVDDYINCGNQTNLDVNYLTIELWLRVNSWVADGGIIAKGNDTYRQYWMWTYDSAISEEIDEGTINNYALNPTLGQWEHLVLLYNGSNIVTYRNGTQVNSYPQTSGTINSTTQPLLFGSIPGYSFLNGNLDEVRISAVARSTSLDPDLIQQPVRRDGFDRGWGRNAQTLQPRERALGRRKQLCRRDLQRGGVSPHPAGAGPSCRETSR